MNLEQFEPDDKAEICAFMKTRLQGRRPGFAPRKPAGRFTGAAQGGGGFRAAGVAPRLPPRDKNDVSCVNCGRKGHMAADCRQPRAEMGKRPCFNCGKTGHLARACPEKKAAIKAITNGDIPKAAFLGCVQVVDSDGFTRVPGRPRPQSAHVHDFVARAAANTLSTNRFRPLTLDDLADVVQDASARRDVGPAVLSAVPPRAPIGQGETVAVANVAMQESADHHFVHSRTHDVDVSPIGN